MVGGLEDLVAVYHGADGLLARARPGQVLVDLTTSSPDLAAALAAEGGARGVACLDAPVTRRGHGRRGGHPRRHGRRRRRGPRPGAAGQHAKLVNQTAVGGIMTGLAEALAHAGRAGLDGAASWLATLGSGTARSFLLGAYGEAMLWGDTATGFAVDHFVKDLTLAATASRRLGLQP